MSEAVSLMSHVSIGSNQLDRALEFYDAVMPSIGARRITTVPDMAVAYGRQFPEFWVQIPHDGGTAETANGVHFAFMVDSAEAVHRFYQAAIDAGARDDGEPGPRPHYTDAYYGCFVRDPDGHKIEAMFWDESKADSYHSEQ